MGKMWWLLVVGCMLVGCEAEEVALVEYARSGDKLGVERLIRQGTSVDQRGRAGRTALMEAAYECHCDIVDVLIAAGAGVNAIDDHGFTPLFYAVAPGHADRDVDYPKQEWVIRKLEEEGGDLEKIGKNGASLLYYAVSNRNLNAIKVLLDLGCKPNVLGGNGQAPLHLACEIGFREGVDLLVKCNANVFLANSEGKTSIEIAREVLGNVPDGKGGPWVNILQVLESFNKRESKNEGCGGERGIAETEDDSGTKSEGKEAGHPSPKNDNESAPSPDEKGK